MEVSDVRGLCRKYRIRPSKKLGQNFLVDESVAHRMCEAAQLTAEDFVVEVGPGLGALTEELAKRVKKVVAVEMDRRMAEALREVLGLRRHPASEHARSPKATVQDLSHSSLVLAPPSPSSLSENKKWGAAGLLGRVSAESPAPLPFVSGKIEIIEGDILKIPNSQFLIPNGGYKVVASLPYSITSAVLRKFTEEEPRPSLVVVLTQKEVAERVCARPSPRPSPKGRGGGGNMSVLSVAVQYYGRPEIVATVPRSAFWPQPEVDSAILRIATRTDHELDAASGGQKQPRKEFEKRFFQIVRIGFSSRRKQLKNNLAAGLRVPPAHLVEMLKQTGLDPKVRAQELSVGQWIELAKF